MSGSHGPADSEPEDEDDYRRLLDVLVVCGAIAVGLILGALISALNGWKL